MGKEIDSHAIADGRLEVLRRILIHAWAFRAVDDALHQGVSPPIFPRNFLEGGRL